MGISMIGPLGSTSSIKSVQRGKTSITTDGSTVNVTISSVNMSKTEVNLLSDLSGNYVGYSLSLTSSTNLQISTVVASPPSAVSVSWEVIEYA